MPENGGITMYFGTNVCQLQAQHFDASNVVIFQPSPITLDSKYSAHFLFWVIRLTEL